MSKALKPARLLLVGGTPGLVLLHVLQPSLSPRTTTISEYALTGRRWPFTGSMLGWASGSTLIVRAVWRVWPIRRWLISVWTAGVLIVALVPTDPGGDVTSLAGGVHDASALAAIVALWAAQIASIPRPATRVVSLTASAAVLVGLLLSPFLGFGAGERLILLADVMWLFVIAAAFRRISRLEVLRSGDSASR